MSASRSAFVAFESSRSSLAIDADSNLETMLSQSAQAKERYFGGDDWFKIFELPAIVSATGIAWCALERNTEGILASCSTQLFDAAFYEINGKIDADGTEILHLNGLKGSEKYNMAVGAESHGAIWYAICL